MAVTFRFCFFLCHRLHHGWTNEGMTTSKDDQKRTGCWRRPCYWTWLLFRALDGAGGGAGALPAGIPTLQRFNGGFRPTSAVVVVLLFLFSCADDEGQPILVSFGKGPLLQKGNWRRPHGAIRQKGKRERERESIGLCCRVYVNWLAKVIMTTRDLISLEN